jgi:hydrogenase maturation protein HypF
MPFTKDERAVVDAAIRSGINTVRTSSMGRLFDAVCAMLGIHYENRYEGECAIMLENAAQRALDIQHAFEGPDAGDFPVEDVQAEQERLALTFHLDVAKAILVQCRLIRTERGIQNVCLSGGVFQNKILMEEALRLLRADGFTVYYNVHVPPNDGGIALGQNFVGMMSL